MSRPRGRGDRDLVGLFFVLIAVAWMTFLGLLLGGCGALDVPEQPGQDEPEELAQAGLALGAQPLTFGRYAGDYDGNRGALLEAIERSVVRWRNATCLPLDVSLEPAYGIRFRPRELITCPSGNTCGAVTYGSDWDTMKIAVSTDTPIGALELDLLHELSHILRRSGTHWTEERATSYPVVYWITTPFTRITQTDLDAVCHQQNCLCQIPETP